MRMHKICAFFGHRDVVLSGYYEHVLEKVCRKLIDEQGVYEFWFTNNGECDFYARRILLDMKENNYPEIDVCIMPAYNLSDGLFDVLSEKYLLLFPEELYHIPWKAAIVKRNEYMVKNADIILCYITRHYGGAYKAVKLAEKLKKKIINIAELEL